MRNIFDDSNIDKAFDAYVKQYNKSVQAMGKSPRVDIYDESGKLLPSAKAAFTTEYITSLNEIDVKNYELRTRLKQNLSGEAYQKAYDTERIRPSATRIAQDLARKDVYYKSSKQGGLYYDYLEAYGTLPKSIKVEKKVPVYRREYYEEDGKRRYRREFTGEYKDKIVTVKNPSKAQISSFYQQSLINEEDFEAMSRAVLEAKYEERKLAEVRKKFGDEEAKRYAKLSKDERKTYFRKKFAGMNIGKTFAEEVYAWYYSE